jgi:imidazolonepropionase
MSSGTLFFGTGPWATFDDDHEGPRGGKLLAEVRERSPFAVFCEGGRIAATGDLATLRARHRGALEVDLGARTVVPGFVDPHTHPVFAGSREDEFEWRNTGRTYQEIAREGGGIRKSVRQLRAASDADLVANLRATADAFLALGTTTIEAKSGYGLSPEDELRSLRAVREVAATHPLGIVPTFLGAHEFPDEYRDDREGYVRLLVEEMLPRVVAEGLATACDVFCEEGVFDVGQSRRILKRARELGLAVKIHADEITSCGGAELAAEVGALSADHLVHVSTNGMQDLLQSGVVPILLPATSFVLRLARDAPAKAMMDLGLPVAIATDFNPGSSPTRSMPLVMTFACVRYGLTAAQALTAATVNAAHAIGAGNRIGRLKPGFEADLIALDLPNVRHLPYRFGENFVAVVVKAGEIVVDRRR